MQTQYLKNNENIHRFFNSFAFVVTSCNEKQLKSSTDLKEVIKANNAYADINWVDIKDLDKLMAKDARKIMIFFYVRLPILPRNEANNIHTIEHHQNDK